MENATNITANTSIPMWEDPQVVAYQCRAKNHMFMSSMKLGKGAPAGLTANEINAELDVPNGKYVAFPLKQGGMVVRARRAKQATA